MIFPGSGLRMFRLLVIGLMSMITVPGVLGNGEFLCLQQRLVSLYRENERCFERVAQAGLEEKWEEIRKVKPPAEEILGDLDEATGLTTAIRRVTLRLDDEQTDGA